MLATSEAVDQFLESLHPRRAPTNTIRSCAYDRGFRPLLLLLSRNGMAARGKADHPSLHQHGKEWPETLL